MADSYDEIMNAALSLPPDSRALLAEHLLESLDLPSQKEIDELWAEEAERRVREVKNGDVQTVSGESVIRSLRSRHQ